MFGELQALDATLARGEHVPQAPTTIAAAIDRVQQIAKMLEIAQLPIASRVVKEWARLISRPIQSTSGHDTYIPIPLDVLPVLRGALGVLRVHIQTVSGDAEVSAARLLPWARSLAKAIGECSPAEEALFYPDLWHGHPFANRPAVGHSSSRHATYAKAHARYQNGLLRALRGDRNGWSRMRQALTELEAAEHIGETRSLWWVAGAFLEAVCGGGFARSAEIRKLCSRIERQIAAHSSVVPDRDAGDSVDAPLIRGLLRALAAATSSGPLINAVCDFYQIRQRSQPVPQVTRLGQV